MWLTLALGLAADRCAVLLVVVEVTGGMVLGWTCAEAGRWLCGRVHHG
jgi:hypothetical protein